LIELLQVNDYLKKLSFRSSDDDADALAVLAYVSLRRLAPAAIQQDAGRGHACGWWRGLLAYDPG
jgi:hypothetical protein